MKEFSLQAKVRQTLGKSVRKVRAAGSLPAVVYGNKSEAKTIEVPQSAFEKVYRSAHGSHLIDLQIDGAAPMKVLVHDVQYHPLSQRAVHVDFLQVNMTEKITAEVPVRVTGESPAVKGLGGTLLKNITEVTVSCLPDKLIDEIVIDIAKLQTFEDVVTLGSLQLPEGVSVVGKPDEVVVMVTPPRSDEELAALENKVEENVEQVETVKKEKPADEEAVEGEEAAAPAPAAEKK